MIHRVGLIAIVVLVIQPMGARATEGKPTIIASSVEDTGATEVVRMVVSPSLKYFEHKIICSNESIRVRLNGIGSRSKEIEDLTVPVAGPMRHVRIVPRGKMGSVVQLYPRRRPLAACGRTTLIALDNEIVISTALSKSDKIRRKRILGIAPKPVELVDNKAQPKTRNADEDKKPVAATEKSNPNPKAQAKKAASPYPSGKGGGFLRKGSKSKKEDIPAKAGSELDSNMMRIALGFGFAAIIAGVALLVKRRKGGLSGNGDTIEILSSKRLGAHQQLVLASVQGTKFLLAVGEKSVSTLGQVRDDVEPLRSDETIFGGDESPPPSSEQSVKDRIIQELQSQSMDPAMIESDGDPSIPFHTGFKKAINAVQNTDGYSPPVNGDLSNAAGLIAMARMRANLRQNSKHIPTAEA